MTAQLVRRNSYSLFIQSLVVWSSVRNVTTIMSATLSTCLSCDRSFADHLHQRAHYQSEWHRYNLKRKVALLKPISEAEFQTLQTQHLQQQQAVADDQSASSQLYCQPCGKLFTKNSQWENHLKSNKHQNKLSCSSASDKPILLSRKESQQNSEPDAEEDDDSDWESISDSDDVEFDSGLCLFCEKTSSDLTENLKHMTLDHSFFLPDAEYIIDAEGLVSYLNKKVRFGKLCLWCNEKGKSFDDIKAVQRHMMDKGHCKVRLEPGDDVLEFSDFYDFSSSHPEAGGPDDEVSDNSVEVNADMELVLPSGATVGHRSLRKYYKQNLPEKDAPKPVSSKTRTVNGRQLMSQYQSMGYRNSSGAVLAAKARDQQFIQKRLVKLGIKNNRLQRFFRSQIDF